MKKSPNKNLSIYIIVFVVFVILLIVRFLSPEDDWICKNGEWVRHGNPSNPMPTETCAME